MLKEKEISFSVAKKYFTLGNPQADNVWFILHGYGQLSEYFSRQFESLIPNAYLIFPQAPSKFYINGFERVGASWLTKEDTKTETKNNFAFLDEIWSEEYKTSAKIWLFGFSQGVSMVTRWAAHQRLAFHRMILWAGGLPKELEVEDFNYLTNTSELYCVAGKNDPFINEEKLAKEKERIEMLFPKVSYQSFEGGHEINKPLLKKLSKA